MQRNEPIDPSSSWDGMDDLPGGAVAKDQRRSSPMHASEPTPVDSSGSGDNTYSGVYLTQSISPNGRHSRTRVHLANNKVRYLLLLLAIVSSISTYFGTKATA